jgi:hypothetical protein
MLWQPLSSEQQPVPAALHAAGSLPQAGVVITDQELIQC